jgi:hypothetical protein
VALDFVRSEAAGDFELLERLAVPPGAKSHASGVLVGLRVFRIGAQSAREMLRGGGVVAGIERRYAGVERGLSELWVLAHLGLIYARIARSGARA